LYKIQGILKTILFIKYMKPRAQKIVLKNNTRKPRPLKQEEEKPLEVPVVFLGKPRYIIKNTTPKRFFLKTPEWRQY
jgi:hypothetical protein